MKRILHTIIISSFLPALSFCQYDPSIGNRLQLTSLYIALQLGSSGLSVNGCKCVTEGGDSTSYTLVLNNAPSQDVTVTITPDEQLLVNGVPGSRTLVFTSRDWSTPRTMTITARDDSIVENNHTGLVTNLITAGDPDFIGKDLGTLEVDIADNDIPNVLVSNTALNVGEGGGGATYYLKLSSTPRAEVLVDVNFDPLQVQVNGSSSSPVTIRFKPDEWDTAKTMTITPLDDSIAETSIHNSSLSHSTRSSDADFNTIPGIFGVTTAITDNETPGLLISNTSLATTENSAGVDYSLSLSAKPRNTVQITVTPDNQTAANGSTAPLVLFFAPGNWNSPQTVTVTARNDNIARGRRTGSLSHSVAGDPGVYDTLSPALVQVDISDDDNQGFTFSAATGPTSESGGRSQFNASLTSEPGGTVTLEFQSSNPQEGLVETSSLTFTPANWQTPQPVYVKGVDDTISDGAVNWTVSASVAGGTTAPEYLGTTPPAVAFVNQDNPDKWVWVTGVKYTGAARLHRDLDIYCNDNTDPNYPGNRTYAAFLATGSRYPCTNPDCNPAGGQNWILDPETTYMRPNGVKVALTNAQSIWSHPLANPLCLTGAGDPCENQTNIMFWSGINGDWTPNANNCSEWNDGTSAGGSTSVHSYNSQGVLLMSAAVCNATYPLLCVEQ